jgi:hypothetical protein
VRGSSAPLCRERTSMARVHFAVPAPLCTIIIHTRQITKTKTPKAGMDALVSTSASSAPASVSKCRAKQKTVTRIISTHDLPEAHYFQTSSGKSATHAPGLRG